MASFCASSSFLWHFSLSPLLPVPSSSAIAATVDVTQGIMASCQSARLWAAYHLTAILVGAIIITDADTGFPVACVLILFYLWSAGNEPQLVKITSVNNLSWYFFMLVDPSTT